MKKLKWVIFITLLLAVVAGIFQAVSAGKPEEDSAENVLGENTADGETGSMEMVIFKIGKADAMLLMSEGKTLLIDTGEDEDADEILEYLDENNIDSIDVMILSHFDKDHVGGADKIIENMEVETICQPDYVKEGKQYEEYAESVKTKAIAVVVPDERVSLQCGEMEVIIYPPEKDFYEVDNNYSLAVTVIHGQNRFFFTGDAESERIKELIEKGAEIEGGLAHNFLKVPHHGREDDMLDKFLDEISPSTAVITCSEKNPPDMGVTALLENCGISVYLTMDGNLYVESDGKEILIAQ